MARTSIQNVLDMPDVAQAWNFDLFLPTIPGSPLSGQNLMYRCKSSEIPGFAIEPVKIELHGVAKQEAGRATYSHTFNSAFIVPVDFTTILAFRAWRAKMRDWKNNTGSNSQVYKINAELDLYNNAGDIGQTFIIAGAFPTDITAVQLDGSQAGAPMELTVAWSFDYVNDGVYW